MKITLFIVVCLMSSGCTMEGSIADGDKNKVMSCVDTRDGESFTFNTNDMSNVRIGFGADSCVDLVDSTGTDRTLCRSMESFLKCK